MKLYDVFIWTVNFILISFSFSGVISCGKLTCSTKAVADGSEILCPDGTTQIITNGVNGSNGVNGVNGINSTSCSVVQSDTGASITCGDSTATVSNGTNGTGITVVELCPDAGTPSYPNNFPEYALKLGTELYGVYFGPIRGSNGNTAFLALIPPGLYQSTGATQCVFTVNADGTIKEN